MYHYPPTRPEPPGSREIAVLCHRYPLLRVPDRVLVHVEGSFYRTQGTSIGSTYTWHVRTVHGSDRRVSCTDVVLGETSGGFGPWGTSGYHLVSKKSGCCLQPISIYPWLLMKCISLLCLSISLALQFHISFDYCISYFIFHYLISLNFILTKFSLQSLIY